jgi:asparagine N-glycosylation enzyme membrane subunit Stt3
MSVLQPLEKRRHEEMYASELHQLVLVQALWMVILFSVLQFLGLFSLEQYFVLSYVGFVVGVGLFAPAEPTPRWWRSVQVVLLMGFLGLCYLVFQTATDVIFV